MAATSAVSEVVTWTPSFVSRINNTVMIIIINSICKKYSPFSSLNDLDLPPPIADH